MDYCLQNFISDCAIRHPRNGNSFTTHGKKYIVKVQYGKFSVPFMNVICEETGFEKTINLNHQHYNDMVRAIIEDYNK
jgi:cytochrome c oxidase assembly protein Cox11